MTNWDAKSQGFHMMENSVTRLYTYIYIYIITYMIVHTYILYIDVCICIFISLYIYICTRGFCIISLLLCSNMI